MASTIQGDVQAELNAATALVNEKFAMAAGWIEDGQESLNQYLQDLASAGSSMFDPAWPDMGVPKDVPIIDFSYLTGFPSMDGLPDAPDEPADPAYPEMPTKPAYTLPVVPTLHDIVIPDFPSLSMPSFSATVPVDYSVVPNPVIENGSTAYNSELLDALKDKLLDRIENGGTGLDPDIEQAMYDRDQERASLALAETTEKLADEWARRGFSLPDGALAEAITNVHVEYQNKRLDTSRDIAIKQAELEQKNISESLTQAIDIEGKTMDWAEKVARRVFEWSKAVADSSIEVCKTWITKYNAGIESYKAQAQVFADLIQAEMIKVQIYKERIAALALIAQVDELHIKAYTAQIDAIKTLFDAYRTEIEAVKAIVDLERAKIENYRSRVEAYAANVNATVQKFTGEVEGYKAKISGYTAIQGINVEAIKARNQAYGIEIEARVKALDASLQTWVHNKAATMEGVKGSATIVASVLQGALAAVSAQAHISGSGSASEAYAESKSMTA